MKGLKARAKRELDRLSRQAAVEALDHLMSWLRDLWAVGQAGEEAALNRDHAAELRDQSVARPEYYGHLLELAGGHAQGSVSERRPRAGARGAVLPFRGGHQKWLRS